MCFLFFSLQLMAMDSYGSASESSSSAVSQVGDVGSYQNALLDLAHVFMRAELWILLSSRRLRYEPDAELMDSLRFVREELVPELDPLSLSIEQLREARVFMEDLRVQVNDLVQLLGERLQ